MTFIEELRQIFEESKPNMGPIKEKFEKEQEALANKFMHEFVFSKIREEYRNTPWLGRFSIDIIFSNGVWKVKNRQIMLGETTEYSFYIAPYIWDIAKSEGIKVVDQEYDEQDQYYISLEFKVHNSKSH